MIQRGAAAFVAVLLDALERDGDDRITAEVGAVAISGIPDRKPGEQGSPVLARRRALEVVAQHRQVQSLAEAARPGQQEIDEADFRGYAARDRALFAAAYLLYEEDRVAESQAFFQRLFDEHPGSSLVPEAAGGRAESFFEAADMGNAVRYYQLAVEHPGSPLVGYSLYKVGWAHINLRESGKAIVAFDRVSELGKQGQLAPADAELLIGESFKGRERARQIP